MEIFDNSFSFLHSTLTSIGRMGDSWFVVFSELLYVFIPLLAIIPASTLPHRFNRLRHYFNPIDNPINAVPPTVPATAPMRVGTPVQEPSMLSSLTEAHVQSSGLSLEKEELRSDREAGMVGNN
ncbi:hypothetical protein PENTCL1PPCAC_22202 [Pristionchus entomophagus]|uniref:G protein-coupled receptor n=1 Tax=Pristionchus entomophagus TaxID=358040 RepID=A0AAV5U0N6_9BILA|nr:hypothetical protein PENTCL1PPCAC_22202 [Pristionchus entomophagus]